MGRETGSVEPSSIVLNIGDPHYPTTAGDSLTGRSLSAADVLPRLLVYSLLADRVVVPSRHLLNLGPVWELVHTAPDLLREGIIAPQLRSDLSSFETLVRERGSDRESIERAKFLDDNSRHFHEFPVGRIVEDYQRTLVDDCGPDGALSRLLPGARRGVSRAVLDDIAAAYAQSSGLYNELVARLRALPPRARPVALRWAAARYYSVPARHDLAAVLRDVPPSAGRLLKQAGVVIGPGNRTTESSELMAALATPLRLTMLRAHDAATMNKVIASVLELRSSIPDARERFRTVTVGPQAGTIDVVDALDSEFRRQQESLTRRYPHTVTEVAVSLGLNVAGFGAGLAGGAAVGALLGIGAGTTLGLGWSELVRVLARRRAKVDAPWAVLASQMKAVSWSHDPKVR